MSDSAIVPVSNALQDVEAECKPHPDEQLIVLWTHGRSKATQEQYNRYARRFLDFVRLPLTNVTLADLQAYARTLEKQGLSSTSQESILRVVQSLLSFGVKVGALRANVGVALVVPTPKDTLNERILSESDVHLMIRLTKKKRDRVILKTLYLTGMRVSELSGLKWRDLQEHGNAGQITIFGKGSKTRTVRIPEQLWTELKELGGKRSGLDNPVFVSRKKGERKGKHLSRQQIWQIVHDAADRAKIGKPVSPHWLRHSHASHALNRKCPLHLLRDTLGHSSIETTSRYLHSNPEDSSSLYLPSV